MGAHEIELRLAWERAAGRSRTARRLFEQIAERHRQPHRRYHDLRHVAWVVRHVYELAEHEPVDDLSTVVVAACYHDAVQAGRPGDDERASADLARRELAELLEPSDAQHEEPDPAWTEARIERVARLVEATAHLDAAADETRADADGAERAGPSDHPDRPGAAASDAAVLVDADLAVLGAPPAAYLDYVRGVRGEHPDLPEPEWRRGRAAVLRSLLARPTLYRTPTGRELWEARARANLTAELAGLEPDQHGEEGHSRA